MDYGAAREIERALLEEQPAGRPHHMRDREIDDRQPDGSEHHHRREFEPFDRPAQNQREGVADAAGKIGARSEEQTSELQSLMRISYAVFCLKKKKKKDECTEHMKRCRETQGLKVYKQSLQILYLIT